MVETDYFNNGLKVLHRERQRTLLKFREKVDRTEYEPLHHHTALTDRSIVLDGV